MNVYQWAIKLQDMMSPALTRAQAAYGRFGQGWERMVARLPRGLNMATQSVADLKKKLDGLKGARELMIDTRQISRATREIDALENRLTRLTGRDSRGRFVGRGGGSGGGSGGGFGGGAMGLAKKFLPALGVAGLLAGGVELANSGMKREQTKVAFEQFVGKKGVDPMMKQLNRFADVTPYDNEQVYGAGRTLLSAKVDPHQLNATMTQIGNMAAVSQKDFGEMAASYAKIKQKGFADSGELHMEFGGTAVMDQLKTDLGVNGEQLFKMAEKRQIRFGDIQAAIENLSEKGGLYEGGLEKLANTAGGKMSTFMGTLQNKVTELAEKLNPYLGKLFDFGSVLLTKIDPALETIGGLFMKLWKAAEPLRELFSEVWTEVGNLYTQFVSLTGGMNGVNVLFDVLSAVVWTISTALKYAGELVLWLVTGPLKYLTLIIGAVTAAWWLFNIALTANPIGLVIVGIASLVAGLKYAWENVDGFRYAIIAMWAVAKSVFGSLGQAWDALMKGDFSGIKAALVGGWDKGLANAKAAIQADQKARAATGTKKNGTATATAADPFGAAGAGGKTGGSGKAGKAGGLDSTVSGAKSTHITITLKSLVEHLTINANGVTEGVADMESKVQDALLRVLNSANSVAS